MSTTDAPKFSLFPARNFTGRTANLKQLACLDLDDPEKDAQYVGPDVRNHVSGLASTVRQELYIHGIADDDEIYHGICNLARLDRLLDRNPYTLSGGEQTVLALATAMGRRSGTLLIDGAMEQLSPETRAALVRSLSLLSAPHSIYVADNRLAEFRQLFADHHELPERSDRNIARPLLNPQHYVPYPVLPMEISVTNLGYSYQPGIPVLHQLSLSLKPGKLYVLKGPNGVGKTTLCRILAGLRAPSDGTIHVNREVTALHERPAALCAYHYQDPDLQLFATTVAEEIGSSQTHDRSRSHVEGIIQSFGLASSATAHPMDLPFTLRKRVALAATLAMRRPWMLLDEPTLGQDDETMDAMMTILARQAAEGSGVVVITHSERLMRRLERDTIELRPQLAS